MAGDPITALQSFGYIHSGYFLRRQFDYFTDRSKGTLVVHLLEKSRRAEHTESLDYQGWQVHPCLPHMTTSLISLK